MEGTSVFLGILIGVELVLNAANINLVAFNRYRALDGFDGQVFALFVIVLAAAEAAIAVAIFVNFYNNLATKNAGGLLVFDLPNLPQQGGHNVRFFNNMSVDNDTKNFAPEGNIVGLVPTGTGLMIMANRHVEAFGNYFDGNGTGTVV